MLAVVGEGDVREERKAMSAAPYTNTYNVIILCVYALYLTWLMLTRALTHR